MTPDLPARFGLDALKKTTMTLRQRYDGVIAWFSEHMPVAESELHYEKPFQLLVAVILSAQCTDKRVNMTTPALFAAFPTPEAMAAATPEEIFPYIRSISYPNNKAKNLAGMARMLCAEFGGEVPTDLEAMQRLPGVGRKTANVLGAVLWQREVMPVDTHVFRVSERIGLTTGSKTPLQTERTLERNIPSHLLPIAHHWLILHGRYVCMARSPRCGECGIAPWCRKYAADRRAEAREAASAPAGTADGSDTKSAAKAGTKASRAGKTTTAGTSASRAGKTSSAGARKASSGAGKTTTAGTRKKATLAPAASAPVEGPERS